MVEKRVCLKCGGKIIDPYSEWQQYCKKCWPNKMLKGGYEEDEMEDQTMEKKTTAKVVAKKEAKPKAEKKEGKSFGKSRYTKCSKCGAQKFTREEVYQARVKKFGSEEALLKNYLCRTCKKK